MRKRAVAALVPVLCLGLFAYAKTPDARSRFLKELPKDQKILQALNRLTFGPKPGDVEKVRAMGLKKWIDLQLHPERIPENPALAVKLRMMDTLAMSSEELVRNYPTPQMVKQMVAGQMPFPSDPGKRMLIEKLAARFERKQNDVADQRAPADAPARQPLRDLLTAEQIRTLRSGTPEARLAAFGALPQDKQLEVLAALPAGLRQALYGAATPELRREIEMAGGPQQVVARDLTDSKMLRAVYSSRQLEEVLADFWFNHFNVYLDKGADHYLITEYERDVIRPRVLGKFRDLLEATAKSPAMLFYLDNWQSVGENAPQFRGARQTRRGLNENYGRELMELHTLGVDGGYTQKDVTEVARCFTGWTILQPQRGGRFSFNARLHDPGEKTVLGVKIPAGGGIEDGEKVLDILSQSPATARFISRQLATRFVADDPPPALVDRMAGAFLKSGGDLREVMRTMLASREFWSEGAYRSKMKSPFEMVASAVRAVDADVDYASALANQVAQLGEPLYRKVEPTGYSNSSREWLNSAGLLARMNFALQLADHKVPGVKVEAQNGVSLGSPEFQRR